MAKRAKEYFIKFAKYSKLKREKEFFVQPGVEKSRGNHESRKPCKV